MLCERLIKSGTMSPLLRKRCQSWNHSILDTFNTILKVSIYGENNKHPNVVIVSRSSIC